jgi:hypothetical protein
MEGLHAAGGLGGPVAEANRNSALLLLKYSSPVQLGRRTVRPASPIAAAKPASQPAMAVGLRRVQSKKLPSGSALSYGLNNEEGLCAGGAGSPRRRAR